MANDLRLTFESERSVKRAFKNFEDRYSFKTAENTFKNIFKKVMKPIYDEARNRVPVQRGNLKRAISRDSNHDRKEESFSGNVYVSLRNSKSKSAKSSKYVSYFQSLAVEYGTKQQKAQKFLNGAFESKRFEALAELTRLMREDMERIAEETYVREQARMKK